VKCYIYVKFATSQFNVNLFFIFIFQEALNEDGAGESRGELSVEERQRNLEELIWARSRGEK
jgi:hypothetical protein